MEERIVEILKRANYLLEWHSPTPECLDIMGIEEDSIFRIKAKEHQRDLIQLKTDIVQILLEMGKI